jgi:hypothetical protein
VGCECLFDYVGITLRESAYRCRQLE